MVRLLQSPCSSTSMTVLALASIASTMVDAHGYMTTPLAEFNEGVMKTSFSAKMDPVFPGKFNDNPQANAQTFTEAFKSKDNKYKTLRDLLDGRGPECGYTNPNVSPKPIPADGVVVWQNPDSGEGFVPSHTGPCELWLDNERVFNDDNCAGHYAGGSKAEIKIDFSSCKKNCMLRFYWLSLQEPAWQIYKDCIPLVGNGGNSGDGNAGGNRESTNVMATTSYNFKGYTNDNSPSVAPSPSPSAESTESPTPTPSSSAESAGASTPTSAPSQSPSPSSSMSYESPSPTPTHPKCSKTRPSRKLAVKNLS